MAINSPIEWTISTWNPTTGCSKISPGCKNCYAERMAMRLQAMENPNYANGFELTLQEHMLELPLSWKKPQMIFVNSMSDLFHKDRAASRSRPLRIQHSPSWICCAGATADGSARTARLPRWGSPSSQPMSSVMSSSWSSPGWVPR